MRFVLFLAALVACGAPPSGSATTPPVPLDRSDTEVVFPGADHDLEGVLTLPDRLEGEAVPAVVLIHGSGPGSRDSALAGQLNMGFGFEVTVFADLADQLADLGIATLRYDKRSCFAGNGCDNDYPTPGADLLVTDFVADAGAAADWLATQEGVGSVWVVGHSQGGPFVPHLLTDKPELAGGVMLAGGYRPIDALMGHQLDSSAELLAALGYTEQQAEPVLAPLQELVDDLAALRAGTYAEATLAGAPTAFWSDWMAIDDASPGLAATVDRPILAVGGGYDWNVPPDEARAWGDWLEPLDRGHRAVVLDCVTHALNCVSEPDWMAIGPDDLGEQVDERVSAEIAAFVR